MKINERLKKIGDLVDANSFCLDVGCDHGLLDIYLVKRNKNIKAIASDIAEGPVAAARVNIKRERLDKIIEVRLGNGLDTYSDDVDTIVISGMGGRNMIGIFKRHLEVLKKVDTIILSPNNYQVDVKKFLVSNGFYIANEEFVKDKKFIYQIIIFKKGKRHYTRKELFLGPIFLEKKGILFQEYYKKEALSRKILIGILPRNYWFKKMVVKREIKMIEEELI